MLKSLYASNKVYNTMPRMSGYKNRGYKGLDLLDTIDAEFLPEEVGNGLDDIEDDNLGEVAPMREELKYLMSLLPEYQI